MVHKMTLGSRQIGKVSPIFIDDKVAGYFNPHAGKIHVYKKYENQGLASLAMLPAYFGTAKMVGGVMKGVGRKVGGKKARHKKKKKK